MAPRHPRLARALGLCRVTLAQALPVRPARLLVACSGGADSVAVLGLCERLRHGQQLELVVGHVDHGLRADSAHEAQGVVALARGLGLDCEVTRVRLEAGAGLPARAREARRRALIEQADRHGASAVVLGHTATDQVETMLMHLVRGCGLDGVAAMPRVELPWVRPLLDLTRADTRELAQRLELPFVDDPTNEDESHWRVRLRRVVLPELERENPRMGAAFVAAADQARAAELALQAWAARECASRERRERTPSGTCFRWRLDGWEQLPAAVRTRLLRTLCARAGVDLRALKHQVVDAIDAAALAQASARANGPVGPREPKRWDLHPDRRLHLEAEQIRVEVEDRPNH